MWEKLKKDDFWYGFFMGLLVPIVVFILVWFIDDYLAHMQKVRTVIKDSTKLLIGVFFNLILFRYFMVKWYLDKTGRGLLAITFLWAILYLIVFQLLDKKYVFT
jgi:cobalamin biosynthesis protein CobD/CbiB